MTPQAERKVLRTSADSGTHRYYISSKYNISSRQGSAAITTPPSPCVVFERLASQAIQILSMPGGLLPRWSQIWKHIVIHKNKIHIDFYKIKIHIDFPKMDLVYSKPSHKKATIALISTS